MAQLTAANYKQIRKSLYSAGYGKEELKSLPNLPNESQLLAAFQLLEDWVVNDFAALRTDLQTAVGQTLSVALTKKIMAAFFLWKLNNL